ncbi:hypothetical protein COMA1_90040 [Candidatus Nitrospira nitrosa]|uniref:Uncharacterized protein n=1 Tax=Candidatus Nitrospira nitrosa TaxID=1742972 RepID=A0A0S4LT70_9BACT|nr:hypothetical protein COMA1_90040 [Candidatus Nitrospira nitrosa]
MGITIQLEDESGNPEGELLLDTFLFLAIPQATNSSYACLRFIDLYGNTIFNRLQIPVLIEELHRIADIAKTNEDKQFLTKLLTLTEKCRAKPHLYLRFIGD